MWLCGSVGDNWPVQWVGKQPDADEMWVVLRDLSRKRPAMGRSTPCSKGRTKFHERAGHHFFKHIDRDQAHGL